MRNDRPLLTSEEIVRRNALLLRSPGREAHLYELEDFQSGIPRGELIGWLSSPEPPEEPCYAEGRLLTREDWAALAENRRAFAAAERTKPRWGVCTQRSAFRSFPTAKAVTRTPDDRYDDLMQESAVLPGEPLAVFHTSADGLFYYAAAYFGMGWIAAESVGLCGNYGEWIAAREGSFLLVTASRFTLCADPYEPAVSSMELTMGTTLRLAAGPDEAWEVRRRISYDNYIVELPTRGADGTLRFVRALVPISCGVCEGWLPYTERAVLEQMEKVRGEVYGWGGMLGSRDCSALVMELYRCFGFRLPRNACDLARLPGGIDLTGMAAAEKLAALRALPVGAILYFPGHVMLWRGEIDGRAMCLSAAGSFLPPGSAGGRVRPVNTAALTPLDVVRANGKTWLGSLERAVCPGMR